jgi:hypothetical protein
MTQFLEVALQTLKLMSENSLYLLNTPTFKNLFDSKHSLFCSSGSLHSYCPKTKAFPGLLYTSIPTAKYMFLQLTNLMEQSP